MDNSTITRKNRRSGATVAARLDDFLGWVTVCHTHGAHAEHATKTAAVEWLADPTVWCDGCRHAADAKKAAKDARAAQIAKWEAEPLQLTRNTWGTHPYVVNVNGVARGSITCYFTADLQLAAHTIRETGETRRTLEAKLLAAIADRGLVLPAEEVTL